MGSERRPKGQLRYPEYLELDRLLDLQHPLTAHHDELLFILTHQAFELWFKQLLHEIDGLRRDLDQDDRRDALKLARRAAAIVRLLTQQIDVLETMSALDFLEFRSELEGASGFQSAQFRQLETVLGVRDAERVRVEGAGSVSTAYRGLLAPAERTRLERRLAEPDLEAVFLDLVRRRVPPRDAGIAYLVDLEDLVAAAGGDGGAAAESWRGQLAELAASGEVPGDRLAAASATLERLPQWGALSAAGRAALVEGARRGRALEAARAAGPVEAAAEVELKLLDEELHRYLAVPLAPALQRLAKVGLGEEEAAALARRLEQRLALREVYRRDRHRSGPDDTYEIWLLAETLLELAESLHVFRFRHVKMVERMIGKRRGTGGSPGAAYLEQTLRYRTFPELWRVRTHL